MRVRAGLVLLVATSFAGHARAGERPLEVVLVNLTPDAASSEASKQCVRAVEKKIASDEVHVVRVGETAARKQAGTAGVAIMDWRAEALARLKPRDGTPADAVVLVDCRPELRRLGVVVAPASGGVARIELGVVPDRSPGHRSDGRRHLAPRLGGILAVASSGSVP